MPGPSLHHPSRAVPCGVPAGSWHPVQDPAIKEARVTDDADGMFGVAPALQEATHVDIPDLPPEEGGRSPMQVFSPQQAIICA